ncbi:MAG: single-stranded DNA-binding protein [Agitococcus sp.]|nr:single-stranded DNA-binding protein [Agitococcus sp.]MDO9176953.1 single-stranded DNA-binding protein [Agitococcus sp.]
MQAFGNIATAIEKRTAKVGGKEFYTFRMAENIGKDENRTTTWYSVTAFISELDADMLAKGQFVKLSGRLEVDAFMKKDNTPGAELRCLAFKVEPIERKARDSDSTGNDQD